MTMQLDWLRGCATALVTPFASDASVDEKRLRDLIEYQIDGTGRLRVPCGTTGESVTMTEEENPLAIRTTVELARGRAKVIAGTGSNSTAVTIQRSRNARALGVDGILTVAPYYNKPTRSEERRVGKECRAERVRKRMKRKCSIQETMGG